jgi:hypothetical protein
LLLAPFHDFFYEKLEGTLLNADKSYDLIWEIKNKNVSPEIKKGDKTYTTGPDIAIDIVLYSFF